MITTLNKQQAIEHIESCIKEIKFSFESNYNLFIDGLEDDIRSYLYSLISRNDYFLRYLIDYKFEDGRIVRTKLMHSEAKTFENINSQPGYFDIGILNPTQNEEENEYFIVIEIKWVGRLNQDCLDTIERDIQKILNPGNDVEKGYLLIFNNRMEFNQEFIQKVNLLNTNKSKLQIFFINAVE